MSNFVKKEDQNKILTIQVYKDHLNPRTFKVPSSWFTRASILAWGLLLVTILSSIFAAKEYFSERSTRPALVSELENEVQQLKIALEKKADTSVSNQPIIPAGAVKPDLKATNDKPEPGPGNPLEGKEGTWGGLAEGISVPSAGVEPTIKLDDPRLEWQGKFANFSAGVMFRNPGKGSQQGHIVVLGRGTNGISAHPDGVLNVTSGDHLFEASRGEYFSVSRFRPLKTHLGPYESPSQLNEIQVYVFDLSNKLILLQNFKYGK